MRDRLQQAHPDVGKRRALERGTDASLTQSSQISLNSFFDLVIILFFNELTNVHTTDDGGADDESREKTIKIKMFYSEKIAKSTFLLN